MPNQTLSDPTVGENMLMVLAYAVPILCAVSLFALIWRGINAFSWVSSHANTPDDEDSTDEPDDTADDNAAADEEEFSRFCDLIYPEVEQNPADPGTQPVTEPGQ